MQKPKENRTKNHPSQRAAAATTIELLLERFNKHKI
jgi:hypothetical protein